MKFLTKTQQNILKILEDGAYHSGNQLGEQLSITRTAIWKQIKQLIALGVPINSFPKQGYRLSTPIQLLNEESLRAFLPNQNQTYPPLKFHLFAAIDSTNRYLKELPDSTSIDVCSAETQTEGRGRFGRHWHSPFGENIYCSSRWQFQCDPSELSGLSLVVSLAILNALQEYDLKEAISVKWPNDLYWQDRKLSGTLIEMQAESHGITKAIIGIGINVNSNTKNYPPLDKPCCSLFDATGKYIDRNELIAKLIACLQKYFKRFSDKGFQDFQEEWNEVDYLKNKHINLSHLTGNLSGTARGINTLGQLVLVDEKGVTHYLSSGDASLKTAG